MKVGLLVAIEMEPIFAHYTEREVLPCPVGFELFKVEKNGNEIYILHTGMGEIAAAAGVQYLISEHKIEKLVNFGVVGGLSEGMKKRTICVIDRIVHYKYDCSEFLPLAVGQVDGHDSVFLIPDEDSVSFALEVCPELCRATCCSGDKFVGTEEEKRSISTSFEGDVCDMESAGIVLTCEMNNIPCVLLKAVSDGLMGGAKEFFDELQFAAFGCLTVTDKIIESFGKK